jgi:hypothetical protein
MDNLQEYIEDRRVRNHLHFDMAECEEYITTKYTSSDANKHKRFFYFVREDVYNIVSKFAENNLFEIKVRGKNATPFFEFENPNEYKNWLHYRRKIYQSPIPIPRLRMLNFLELSLMNFITDLTTLQEYELHSPEGNITKFKKIGYGTDQDQQSFIKYLGRKFKEGFTFKAL